MQKALVTGACGQDGSYMCELLLAKGYEVRGLVRPSGNRSFWQLNRVILNPKFSIMWGDITEPGIAHNIARGDYDEIYHFAAVSHVKTSFDDPVNTFLTNTVATARLFEICHKYSMRTKIYHAGSSEMFADQAGTHILRAQSPYAVSKIATHMLADLYNQRGSFIVRGIAYNHESSRRGESFVTRKIGLSLQEKGQVTLGNLHAQRDWHHAKDFVQGAYLAMQQDYPHTVCFASGESHTVLEFAEEACKIFNLDPKEAILTKESLKRPIEVEFLKGDPTHTEKILGWKCRYTFKNIVEDCCVAIEKCSNLRL